ncbi:MAG: MBL fold metallo-hydrolase [Bacteroidota bacterium]
MRHFLWLLLLFSCTSVDVQQRPEPDVYLEVLGIAQDAGYPQIACRKECCGGLWPSPSRRKMVSSLGVVDRSDHYAWLFDATPDFKYQHANLLHKDDGNLTLGGVFITHAHMGHYTGLMHLGREAMGAKEVPVFAMPRLKEYLETNGPWSQLVRLKNIDLRQMAADSSIRINDQLSVFPFQVPHRDEFSETVGFRIVGPSKSALFIPDIDKWGKWERSIIHMIESVDYAFIDGTFYRNGEIPGRDMALIPHPFIEESMALFDDLPLAFRQKVYFIHLNHTNPLLREESPEKAALKVKGYNVATEGLRIAL